MKKTKISKITKQSKPKYKPKLKPKNATSRYKNSTSRYKNSTSRYNSAYSKANSNYKSYYLNSVKKNAFANINISNKKDKIISFKSNSTCIMLNKEHIYILYLYFGIINNMISGEYKENINYDTLYFGKNKQYNKMLNNTKSFKLIEKTRCYFYTSDIKSNTFYDSESDNYYSDFDSNIKGDDDGDVEGDGNSNGEGDGDNQYDEDLYANFDDDDNSKKDNILYYDINDDKNKYMFICFNIGVSKFYETTKPLYYYIKKDRLRINNKGINKVIYKPRFYELITFISTIKTYLETDKYKNIVLCGHSRGMTIATLSAYILLILSVDDDVINTLPEHHNVKDFIKKLNSFILYNQKQEYYLKETLSSYGKGKDTYYNELLTELKDVEQINLMAKDIFNLKLLRKQIQNNIYICGTGGYPILWHKIEEFNIFNEFYQNKYTHIISGVKNRNMQKYDNITYYNKFIYIYEKIIEQFTNSPFTYSYYEDNKLEQLKNIKNINYVYYNFGSIVLNLINTRSIECFSIDKVLNKIESDDKKSNSRDIIYKTKTFNNYHRFEFYRHIFNLYMKFI
jgi:hypothetical protein